MITDHSGVLIKRTDFLSKLRNLSISRCSSAPDHCLLSAPVVLHPKIKIRPRLVVDIAALDRFISRGVVGGLIDHLLSESLGNFALTGNL